MISGYALSYGLLLVTGGRLGDLYGRRRLFLLGVAGFVAASAACGLATSPAGVVDSDVYLRFLARKKDIIIRGGENISPAAIENALQEHPAVLHAACVGMPDEHLGERICAYIVLQAGSGPLPLEEISRFLVVERGLSKSNLPERVEYISEMPFYPAGKILKRGLRDRIAQRLLLESETL